MPAVIKPDLDPQSGKSRDEATSSPLTLFFYASSGHYRYPILRSSFNSQHNSPNSTGYPPSIMRNKNSFAHTIIRA
ncbi:hypothetical protein QBC32DRAFT_320178 [Pseudoneurospora amorphoporcata]|uniref:Uncharacterized protein n=1 Tax=Pseudoneurospora amorphoporcata TaxID=241081 RepID=A0AAN6NJY3_9PEZI|nr:hypothetical protein QBC32DRAFT_320178 [Pseudoneurospora amorphoporcata]